MAGLEKVTSRHIYDAVQAFYAELLESRGPEEKVTIADLDIVVAQAEDFIGNGYTIEEHRDGYYRGPVVHPISRLWTHSLLDSTVYFEWTQAKERPKAQAEVARLLAQNRSRI